MSISKVWIEEDCISCGACEAACPDVFEVKDISEVKEGINYNDYETEIKEAAEGCPVEVIKFS